MDSQHMPHTNLETGIVQSPQEYLLDSCRRELPFAVDRGLPCDGWCLQISGAAPGGAIRPEEQLCSTWATASLLQGNRTPFRSVVERQSCSDRRLLQLTSWSDVLLS